MSSLSGIHDVSTSARGLPVAFWMDTLCIPVDPSALSYRKKAIHLLGKTFQEANAVLVLDRELEIVESANATFVELGLRILCSGWAKRLWTLQEAALASKAGGMDKLYFQMCDGPWLYRRFTHSREMYADERHFLQERDIITELETQIPSVQDMRQALDFSAPFWNIYLAIEHRTTSKLEDVPVCIASLLGKDLTTIVSASDLEQRMTNFYILMGEIPTGILWSENIEKLSLRPFRWAPKAINGSLISNYMPGTGNMSCDADGLHFKALGFILAEGELERHGDGSVFPYIFRLVSGETGEAVGQLDIPLNRQKRIPLQRDLALIFPPDAQIQNQTQNALVVVIESEIDDGIHSKELVCKTVGYLYSDLPKIPRPNVLPHTEFHGRMTADEQRWCMS